MKRLLFALLSFLPAILFGQNTVSGYVVDSKTGEPLPYATVYINGTTKGTVTGNDGRFELKNISFPSTIVFSFVGYKTQARDLMSAPGKMNVTLETNDELPEVVISGKVKKKDLSYFKRMFLGDDRWGRNAVIRNEQAIRIDTEPMEGIEPDGILLIPGGFGSRMAVSDEEFISALMKTAV